MEEYSLIYMYMKNFQLFFFLISCLYFGGCSTDKKELKTSINYNQEVTLDTVEIISRLKDNESVYIYYFDNFQDFTPLKFQGAMIKKIVFQNFLLLKETNQQIIFPIQNSEKVYLTKKGNTTILSSDNNERSDELGLLVPIIKYNQPFFSGPDLPLEVLDKKYKNIFEEIDSLNIIKPLSKKYIVEVKSVVSSHYLLNLITPFLNPKNGKYEEKLIDQVKRLEAEFHNEASLKNSDYGKALIGYSRYLARESLNTPDEFKAVYDSISSNFSGKIKDFLQFYYLNNSSKSSQELNIYLKAYIKDSKSNEYISYLTEKYIQKPSEKNEKLLSIKNNFESYINILNQNKGKIIYIDFWASWCMPCRAEIPDMKKLMFNYKGKDLVFLSFSMDSNKTLWQKAIHSEGLEGTNNNFLVSKNFESTLAKQFKIQTIPRYILIGKDGKVINSDAPRPSDPKIRQIFDDLLKKK
jgi:thiol-disulfide isomerase/thioredoxin